MLQAIVKSTSGKPNELLEVVRLTSGFLVDVIVFVGQGNDLSMVYTV